MLVERAFATSSPPLTSVCKASSKTILSPVLINIVRVARRHNDPQPLKHSIRHVRSIKMAGKKTITTITSITQWDEDRSLTTTPRITAAHVAFDAPDISATVKTEYLMTYLPSGNASFIFTEQVSANSFGDRKGTFITQGKGDFDMSSHSVTGSFDIVKGTGTAELGGIVGSGRFGPAEKPGQLKYEFSIEGLAG